VPQPSIHLVNPLSIAFAGSERRTLNYYRLLSGHADVTLWAEKEPDAALAQYPTRRIDPANGTIPSGGTLVLVGVYAERESWLALAKPERLIIVFNTPELSRLHRLLDFCARNGLPQPQLIFCSESFRSSAGLAGFVDWGLYDFETFKPAPPVNARRSFTVGRLSRDEDYKHHPQDTRLYRMLVEKGMRVRLMGATAVRRRLEDHDGTEVLGDGIEVLAVGSVAAHDFLHSLDAFIYRTDPAWHEAAGRVVVEAMACGLPVVLGRSGGYRELIDEGKNGFLFDTHRDALRCLDALRADPDLAERIGAAARATVVERFGPTHVKRVREFFLRAD
jgi:glycosyltransferase involved in cell wall biosynthesis